MLKPQNSPNYSKKGERKTDFQIDFISGLLFLVICFSGKQH